MEYKKIVKGIFRERPNRFIAYVDVEGMDNNPQVVHVKNTGRCKELLVNGATVYLEESDNPNRKTKYDLVVVRKNKRIINMDSQAPNKVVQEWLNKNGLYKNTKLVAPEKKYGESRFDFYIEGDNKKAWMEVKGVTLEKDGVVLFPDAPSKRAVKHIEHLIKAKEEGFAQIAALFTMVAAIEKDHEERYKQLAANIEAGKVYARETEQVWQCRNCGYTYIGQHAPLKCPVCAHPQSYFELKSKNY